MSSKRNVNAMALVNRCVWLPVDIYDTWFWVPDQGFSFSDDGVVGFGGHETDHITLWHK